MGECLHHPRTALWDCHIWVCSDNVGTLFGEQASAKWPQMSRSAIEISVGPQDFLALGSFPTAPGAIFLQPGDRPTHDRANRA